VDRDRGGAPGDLGLEERLAVLGSLARTAMSEKLGALRRLFSADDFDLDDVGQLKFLSER
jgi:hypothetical protein